MRESTLSVFPQIQENGAVGAPKEHENEYTPGHGFYGGEPNTIPVGTNRNTVRVSSLARFPGITYTGWEPPDCDMAVGPNHIVATVNVSIAFFDKRTGARQFQQTLNAFFGSVGIEGSLGDPKCFYDKISNRFVVLVDAFPESTAISKQYIAVSATNNPNGNWYKYKFDSRLVVGSESWWLDYPGLGGNKDAIVVTGNMFPLAGTSSYGGCLFMVIEKSKLLTGAAPKVTLFNDRNAETVQPMRTVDGSVDKVYAVGHRDGSTMNLYAFTALTTTPVLTHTLVSIPTWSIPSDWALTTGGKFLDSFDGRVFNAAWRAGSLVTSHTVQSDVMGSNCMVRWYDFATNNWPSGGSPTLTQSGNIKATSGVDYHMPAVNVNKFGDISCLYTRSGNSIVADMVASARKTVDPLGAMSAPQLLAASTGNVYGGFSYRWGDYFAVSVDPSDDYTFWGFAMIGQGGSSWTTAINKWQVTLPVAIPIAADSVAVYQGGASSGTVGDVQTANNAFYTIGAINQQGLGRIAAAELSFTFPGVLADVSTLEFEVKMHGVGRATGMLHLYNWQIGDYEWVKSFTMQANPSAKVTIPISVPWEKYIGPGNQVKAVVRSILPTRIASSYTLKIDLASLLYRN